KPGACTRAHGGVLFIDEIGELHSLQMNKLLKVLEDRKVILESAYYNENDKNTPQHVHDIFTNGLPADFRLVGATTRIPDELPPALRSRCLEIFFKPLQKNEIRSIILTAVKKIKYEMDDNALDEISRYASNGREAVNIVQLAAGMAQMESLSRIDLRLVDKVLNNGHFSPRAEVKMKEKPVIGVVNGLAVSGANLGTLLEVESACIPVEAGKGGWTVTGVVEEEEFTGHDRKFTRKSMAKGAVENVLTVLRANYNLNIADYDIHLNFPGGIPVDGPSAGVSMATSIYSNLNNKLVDNMVAMTGEISVHGNVKPVGGVMSKIEAARRAGIKKVIIPADNWLEIFKSFPDISIIPVHELDEVFNHALLDG
ncbi:MAG: magnesium chelatase domain-containing protein, partial [Syntrophomonadaceae bacterium]|nr:magnesium chelatase domain-containing protein [Syntrophomonadaceae bacterium]